MTNASGHEILHIPQTDVKTFNKTFQNKTIQTTSTENLSSRTHKDNYTQHEEIKENHVLSQTNLHISNQETAFTTDISSCIKHDYQKEYHPFIKNKIKLTTSLT